MSDNFFGYAEDNVKIFREYEDTNSNINTTSSRSRDPGDGGLHEIEHQLEIAESRCNILKTQLENMKISYNTAAGEKTEQGKIVKRSNLNKISKSGSLGSLDKEIDYNPTEDAKSYSARPKSSKITIINESSTAKGPVQAINNILNGITDSVNRLSDLHLQVVTPKTSKNEGTQPIREEILESMVQHKIVQKLEPLDKLRSGTNLRRKSSTKACKSSCRGFKETPISMNVLVRNSSLIINRNKRSRPLSVAKTHNIVELYSNKAAVKECVSEQISSAKVASMVPLELREDIPKLQFEKDEFSNQSIVQSCIPGSGLGYIEPRPPRTIYSGISRHDAPTIASKMKEVAKSYFHTFNFKAIPFCAATSTSPSHNIGINLQQVMNLIKMNQPFKGISPTLAHNISLAADRLNSKPCSMMVTTASSRTGTGYYGSSCPLMKKSLNYHHLQEMAKFVPEEVIPEGDEDNQESPGIQTVIITGPSGDMEIKKKPNPIWGIDGAAASQECNCRTQNGVDFHHVAQKYQIEHHPPNSAQNSISQRISKSRSNALTKKSSKPIKISMVTKTNGVVKQFNSGDGREVVVDEYSKAPLQGREKTLRDVLMTLHDEFEKMTKRYDDLSKKEPEELSEDVTKELELLEKELSSKETEITMVMDLYKEVLALKQQVQNLKQKSSQANISKFKEYNNPKAAFHLTKLLKQIQHYQMKYKKDTNVNVNDI